MSDAAGDAALVAGFWYGLAMTAAFFSSLFVVAVVWYFAERVNR